MVLKSAKPKTGTACESCTRSALLGKAPGKTSAYEDHALVPEHIRDPYDRAIVIDGLATPNTFNVDYPAAAPALTREQLDNVRRSGITIVNHTIFASDVAEYDHKIRLVKDDSARNPGTLMLVERFADMRSAKATGRLGIAIGFQGMEFLQSDLSQMKSLCDANIMIIDVMWWTTPAPA